MQESFTKICWQVKMKLFACWKKKMIDWRNRRSRNIQTKKVEHFAWPLFVYVPITVLRTADTPTKWILRRTGAGRDDKPTKQIKSLLNKERSTRLEGSFGNEKEHYLLNKIKARSPDNEQVWLYFGVHTANAVLISKRRQKLANQNKIAA